MVFFPGSVIYAVVLYGEVSIFAEHISLLLCGPVEMSFSLPDSWLTLLYEKIYFHHPTNPTFGRELQERGKLQSNFVAVCLLASLLNFALYLICILSIM